jgi:hypothetical protein
MSPSTSTELGACMHGECANALLADDRLEALRVQPDNRHDIGGDALNS